LTRREKKFRGTNNKYCYFSEKLLRAFQSRQGPKQTAVAPLSATRFKIRKPCIKGFDNTASTIDQNIVAIDALVDTSASKAYIIQSHAADALPFVIQNASYQGQDAEFIRVAVNDAELESYVASAGNVVEVVDLPGTPAARAKFVAQWAKKIAKKNKNAPLPLLLLPLAACGGGDSVSNPTGVVSAAELNALDAASVAVVDATAVITITGMAAAIVTASQSAGITTAASYAVTVDTGSATVAQALILDADTTGLITATITEGDLATLTTLTDANTNNALTITVTDTSANAAE